MSPAADTPTLHVFVGPTLTDHNRTETSVCWHGPIRHGDLMRLSPSRGERILILDGVYQQAPPIRHKELIWAARRGAALFGSASIGALRAAELRGVCMTGLGNVYHAYASGQLVEESDVSVLHLDDEAGWRPLTVPAVNIRLMLNRLRNAGSLTREEANELLAASLQMHFTERTPARLVRAWRSLHLRPAAEVAVSSATADTNTFDQKAADARSAIKRLLSREPWVSGESYAATGTRAPQTEIERRWAHESVPLPQFEGLTAHQLVTFVQLFDEEFTLRARRWFDRDRDRASSGRPGGTEPTLADLRLEPGNTLFAGLPDIYDPNEWASISSQCAVAIARNRQAAELLPGWSPERVTTYATNQLARYWQVADPFAEGYRRGFTSAEGISQASQAFVVEICLRVRQMTVTPP